jgi:hypothetical protein
MTVQLLNCFHPKEQAETSVIRFDADALKQGSLKTIRVDTDDLPAILPPGSQCQIFGVSPQQLALGDLVATQSGRIRRFWSSDGKVLWVTDQSGLNHLTTPIKQGLVPKVIARPSFLQNLAWMLGAAAGRLRRKG